MTDIQFEILDELYFVKSLDELKETFVRSKANIEEETWHMVEKKWIKVLDQSDNEIEVTDYNEFISNKNLLLNISKKGLIAHNQV